MASKLYEQAVIEAKAIKEAALKNAQESVLEKYSEQIKEAVESVLEQDDEEEEDVLGDQGDVLDAEDELTPDVLGEPEDDMGGDLGMDLNTVPEPEGLFPLGGGPQRPDNRQSAIRHGLADGFGHARSPRQKKRHHGFPPNDMGRWGAFRVPATELDLLADVGAAEIGNPFQALGNVWLDEAQPHAVDRFGPRRGQPDLTVRPQQNRKEGRNDDRLGPVP